MTAQPKGRRLKPLPSLLAGTVQNRTATHLSTGSQEQKQIDAQNASCPRWDGRA